MMRKQKIDDIIKCIFDRMDGDIFLENYKVELLEDSGDGIKLLVEHDLRGVYNGHRSEVVVITEKFMRRKDPVTFIKVRNERRRTKGGI